MKMYTRHKLNHIVDKNSEKMFLMVEILQMFERAPDVKLINKRK